MESSFLLLSQPWEVVPASEEDRPERSDPRNAIVEAQFILSVREDVKICSYGIWGGVEGMFGACACRSKVAGYFSSCPGLALCVQKGR